MLFVNIFQTQRSIDTSEIVTVGGIRQWIRLNGEDTRNPVLLFLHGGPGGSVMSYSRKFTSKLERHFVVVQWDQRGTGQTEKLNPSSIPSSVALFENDAFEMVRYLSHEFGKEKIFLMGQSWGGFLGLLVAWKHPELLAACVAMGPMVSQLSSERIALDSMIDRARRSQNQQAIDELSRVKIPFENGEQLYYHRKWLSKWQGQRVVQRSYVETWAKKWLALINEASSIDLAARVPEIRCPVYFLVGARDYQTNRGITEQYFMSLKAPKKELLWFAYSAHLVNITEPAKMQEVMINILKSTR